MKTTPTQYEQQATDFLSRHGLKIAIKLSNTKEAPWQPAGNHYRVTLSRGPRHPDNACLTFDFWGSVNDAKPQGAPSYREDRKTGQYVPTLDGKDISPTAFDRERAIEIALQAAMKHPTPYDVLACISSDVHCPDTFEDFCAEYGYDTDSRKAEQTFRRVNTFARKLRAFFTETEQSELSEIR